MNLSFWECESFFANIDLTVIGSGIVGLNAAISYKKKYPFKKVLILERGILPSGASSKNAGFACFGSPSEIIEDLTKQTEDETFALVEKRWLGLIKLRNMLGDNNIKYENNGSFELFTNEELFNTCADRIPYLNKHLYSITKQKDVYGIADEKISQFGFNNVNHLIKNRLEGQIDTGEMIKNLILLAQQLGIILINNIGISSIHDEGKKVRIETLTQNTFTSTKVIVATNGFAKQLFPHLEVNPARAQVLVTSKIKNLKLKGTFHYDRGYYYFRNIGQRLLIGGGRNLDFKGEETFELGLTDTIQQSLENLLKTTIIPETEYTVDYKWSGIMGIGTNKTTIVKNLSENVVCAVRLGGMGVAIGSLIGEEAADLCF
ncbi:MAG: FAD-binding oxidoreductase [Bacteroidetes bacterium]|nr:FAD-binding oxidoreductase [Bacteroidota bacterium]HET6245303.1 FAD-dependent oxidoreductase [Bacteroidia bacterium]